MDDWTNNLDQGKQIDVIYTDFEKAFDKVPHYGLLCKLKEYHLDHRLLHWITDFSSFFIAFCGLPWFGPLWWPIVIEVSPYANE